MVDKILMMYDGETAIANPIPGIQEQLDNHNRSLYNINNNIHTMKIEINGLEESIDNLGDELARTNELLMEQIGNLDRLRGVVYSLVALVLAAIAVYIIF